MCILILSAFIDKVVDSAIFIANKDTPVTNISCLEAPLSMEYDLEMYSSRIWGHFLVKKNTPNLFIAGSKSPSNL